MIKKISILIIVSILLVACESASYTESFIEDVKLELVKDLDVPFSHIEIEVIKHDSLTYTVDKLLITIKGEEFKYLYIGNSFSGYELIKYDIND